MQFIAYLAFDGRCSEAFDFYRDVFGGDIVFRMTVGESPMASELPPDTHDRLMHVHLQVGGAALMGADTQPGCGDSGDGGCVNVSVDSIDEAERVWAKLAQGAQVRMPLAPTFWATRFGMLTDRYGKAWMVNGPAAPGMHA